MKKADIKTGFLCNNNCRFCVQGDEKKKYGNKSTAEIKKILKEAKRDCQTVVFTGGEPTIREDLVELVKCAKKLKFKIIQIQSNGRMFASKDFCQKITEAGANEFALALHGHISQLHDYLTGSPGSFQQTCLGIKNLKSLGQAILMNTVVVKSNYRHLPAIAKLLVSLGVEQFQLAFVHPVGSAAKNFDSVVPRMTMVMPYLKKALDIGKYFGIRVMMEAIPYCFLAGYEDCISENIMPPMKIFEQNQVILDFKKLRVNEGKLKGLNCKKCKYFKICEGPWKEYPQKFGWDEFKPVSKSFKKNQSPEKKFAHNLLRIGLACNEKCIFCNVPPEKYNYQDLISANQARRLIKKFVSSFPGEKLIITGGEPTIREDLVELIAYAKKNKIPFVEIQSNSLLLDNEIYVQKLKAAGLDAVFVSLHSASAKIHDKLVGVKGAFERTCRGIKNLLNNDIITSLNIVVNCENYKELPKFIQFVISNFSGVREVSLSVVQPRGRAYKNKKIVPRYNLISPYIKKAIVLAKKNNLLILNPYCGVPLCVGDWYKYLKNCMEYNEKFINDGQQAKIWPPSFFKKIKTPSCALCDLNKFCNGVWEEYADIYPLSDLKPIKLKNKLAIISALKPLKNGKK